MAIANNAEDQPAAVWTDRERAMIRAVLAGAGQAKAAEAGAMSLEEAGDVYSRFFEKLALNMFGSARQFVEESLGASPTVNANLAILNSIGLYRSWQIDDRGKPDFVHPSKRVSGSNDPSQDDEELLRVIRTALEIYRWEQIDPLLAIRNLVGAYATWQIDDRGKPDLIHPKILASRSRKESGQPIDPLLAVLNALGVCLWDQLDDTKPGWVHPRDQARESLAPVERPAAQQAGSVRPAMGNSPPQPAETVIRATPLDPWLYGIEYLSDGTARQINPDGTTQPAESVDSAEKRFYNPDRIVMAILSEIGTDADRMRAMFNDQIRDLTEALADLPNEERFPFAEREIEAFRGAMEDGKETPAAESDSRIKAGDQTPRPPSPSTQMRFNL